MADNVESFFNCWKQLNLQDKRKVFDIFRNEKGAILKENPIPPPEFMSDSGAPSAEGLDATNTVYTDIQLYSNYSYLYYYPTMHWNLDKTPDTDDYWVGIYKDNAINTDYLNYQWIYRTSQGSYNIGQLLTMAGAAGLTREERYVLRIFKGAVQRKDAVSNVLRGHVNYAPTDIDTDVDLNLSEKSQPLNAELREFISVVESEGCNNAFRGINSSPSKVKELWEVFKPQEKQLIFPILENDCLSDAIRYPAPTFDDRPEPKILFPYLGKVEPYLEPMDPLSEPTEIVLFITLNKSTTNIIPVINTKQTLQGKYSFAGVFLPSRNGLYDSSLSIDWQWVGPGYQGETKLNQIYQSEDGPINTHYIGVIFDWACNGYTQRGYTGTSIQATISVTPKEPLPNFEPEFNVSVALRNAQLCALAYQPYSEVEVEIKKYKMTAIKKIYNANTDTHGFVAVGATDVVVAFRGTVSVQNFMSDIWFVRKRVLKADYCQAGFVNALNSVYDSVSNCIFDFLSSGRKITFTGHSLGAALASIMMYMVSKINKSKNIELYVYGCPPVGDISFSTFFHGRESDIITISGDPVSSGTLIMLGPWIGFYKPVEVYYLPQYGKHGIDNYILQLKKLNRRENV